MALTTSSAGAAPSATVTTVVSGLDNPRDLAFGPNGNLYVAEAGHGGKAACFSDPEIGSACVGFTSKISRVDVAHHSVDRIARGFVSIADPHGFAATGVDGISTLGAGRIFGIINRIGALDPAWADPCGRRQEGEAAARPAGRRVRELAPVRRRRGRP